MGEIISPQRQSPLLRLPLELRLDIYKHVFEDTVLTVQKSDVAIAVAPVPALTLVNRQTHVETKPLYHSRVAYSFPTGTAFTDIISRWSPRTISSLRHMHFHFQRQSRGFIISRPGPIEELHVTEAFPSTLALDTLHVHLDLTDVATTPDFPREISHLNQGEFYAFMTSGAARLFVLHARVNGAPLPPGDALHLLGPDISSIGVHGFRCTQLPSGALFAVHADLGGPPLEMRMPGGPLFLERADLGSAAAVPAAACAPDVVCVARRQYPLLRSRGAPLEELLAQRGLTWAQVREAGDAVSGGADNCFAFKRGFVAGERVVHWRISTVGFGSFR